MKTRKELHVKFNELLNFPTEIGKESFETLSIKKKDINIKWIKSILNWICDRISISINKKSSEKLLLEKKETFHNHS